MAGPLSCAPELGHPGCLSSQPPGAAADLPETRRSRPLAGPLGERRSPSPQQVAEGPRALCVACCRTSSVLCALPHPGTSVLLEVCRGCYSLEETRRLAAQLPEDTEFYERFLSKVNAVYLEVRAALAVAEASSSSDDGSSR